MEEGPKAPKQSMHFPPPSEVATALPPLGFYLYGVGWLFYDQVFAQLHVSAESAGITFDFLAVRSIALLGAIMALLFVGSGFYHRRDRLAYGDSDYTKVIGVAFVTFAFITAAAVFLSVRLILLHAFELTELEADLTCSAIAAGSVGIVIVFASWSVNFPDFNPNRFSMRHGMGLAVIVSIILLVLAAGLGITVGDQLKSGNSIEGFYLSVPRVKILVAPSHRLVEQCGLLLGVADGNDLVYSYTKGMEAIYYLPVQETVLAEMPIRPC